MSKKTMPRVLVAIGVILIGGFYYFYGQVQKSEAQATGPRPLQVADIDFVQGLSTDTPLANYPAGNAAYAGQEISYDNEGISVFIAPSTQTTAITTDGNIPECGHVGIQEWKGANYAYKLTDANTWQKRRASCAGMVVIGSSGQIRAQTLTLKGTSVEGKSFTLPIRIPDSSAWDREVGGGSRRLYVDDTGSTYSCYSDGFSRVWPNECEFSPQAALTRGAVGQGFGAVAGNGLCQAGETTATTPQDCPDTNVYSFTWGLSSVANQQAEVKAGSKALVKMKLRNTGTSEVLYTVGCTTTPSYPIEYKYFTPPTETSLGSAPFNPLVVSNFEKEFGASIDVSSAPVNTAIQVSCSARRAGAAIPDEKFITDVVTTKAPTPQCTGLTLTTPNNKVTYTQADNVNYTYTCTPAGSRAANVTVQVVKPDGTATTYNSGTNIDTASLGFGTSNLPAGNYTLRACFDPACPAGGITAALQFTVTSSATGTSTPPTVINSSCPNGSKCPKTSACSNGMTCYYPDEQITCQAWPAPTPGVMPMMSMSCPAGTSSCRPDDTNCIEVGQTVPYVSGKWCAMSMSYYSTDGKTMTCAKTEMPPAGYTACRPTDTSCKQKGDTWTDTNANYYCTNSQKCSLATGGTCVGWSESCPAGAKYCSASDQNCIEPGETKTLSTTSSPDSSYWCGGGGGMVFYTQGKAYCEKKVGSSMMMWNGGDIQAVLNRLGSGWGLCKPGSTNCIEPGKTGSSTGWCAWSPATYGGMGGMTGTNGTPRTCPALDATVPSPVTPPPGTSTPPIVGPPVIIPPVRPSPEEMRECVGDEMPGMNNNCRMAMYRWNIPSKTWEKCDFKNPPPYVNVKGDKKAQYTNCMGMFAGDQEWWTEKFTIHPPIEDGEWYNPPWDASAKTFRYDPKGDELVACDNRTTPPPMATAMRSEDTGFYDYMPPCMPVPEEDRGWMLKRFRAEYRMHKAYTAQKKKVPDQPEVTPIVGTGTPVLWPELPVVSPRLPIIEIPASKCKEYLVGVQLGLSGDKRFWKDVKRQVTDAPGFADAAAVNELLDKSKAIIVELDKGAKGRCDAESIKSYQSKLDQLHSTIFPALSSYLSDLESYAEVGVCRNELEDRARELRDILKTSDSDEDKATINGLLREIDATEKEIANPDHDFDYDALAVCEALGESISPRIASLVRSSDEEIESVINDVISKKLEPVLKNLQEQIEKRGKELDELMVKIAQLNQAISEASNGLTTNMADRLAVSVSSASRIADARAREAIQSSKDQLIPLVGKATMVLTERKCVNGADRDMLVGALGNIATVNWVGAKAEEVEKRVTLFTGACTARDFSHDDALAFVNFVAESMAANLVASHDTGITPFADVPTHEWYYGAMVTARDGNFMTQGRPGENVLRQDALLMIMRAVGTPDNELTGNCRLAAPTVTSVSPYAVCAVNAARQHGLTLNGPMTVAVDRVEMVQWLVTLAKLEFGDESILTAYTDLDGLTKVERASIAAVVQKEIMVGVVGPKSSAFSPRDSITRAALAVILEKVLAVTR